MDWWSPSDSAAVQRPSFTGYPFTLGVASGAPLPTGVVLWTRLAPEPLNGGGMGREKVAVRWEVADDEAFARVVQSGTVDAVAAWGHSVHVEVEGLAPAHSYFFRFIAGDEVSPVGRTRTAPAATDTPARLRLGLGSCQHFEHGYYAAHRHLVAEDLDLMVFVGDYIYEGPARASDVRRHRGGEARTLTDYRNRHAQYKTDRDLQALHAALPWLVTWDDHEVDNNYAGARAAVRVDRRLRFSSDAWDGYPAARDRLFAAIADNGVRSCVVLSGDAHCAFVSDLKRDFDHERSEPIATELCGTSITTRGRPQRRTDAIVRQNPHIHYGESARRGYIVLDVTSERCTARLRAIADPADRDTDVVTAAP